MKNFTNTYTYSATRIVLFEKNNFKQFLGYKSNTFLETGYVYAPYIPLMVDVNLNDKYFV